MEAPVSARGLSRIERPNPLSRCVGYTIEIKSTEPDAEDGDMYIARVVSVDEVKNTVKVSYTQDDSNTSQDDDLEDFPSDSNLIAWMHAPLIHASESVHHGKITDPAIPAALAAPHHALIKHEHSQIDAPSLRNCLHYSVEVQSHEEGADPGDMFPGTVYAVNIEKGSLTIVFEVESGSLPEYEDIEYHSRDLAWIAPPKGSLQSGLTTPTSAPTPAPVPVRSQPLLVVGERVEGNYMGQGAWYKGAITAVSTDGLYDIEYDDDETEEGLGADLVRKVARQPLSERLKATATPAPASKAKTDKEIHEEEIERKFKEIKEKEAKWKQEQLDQTKREELAKADQEKYEQEKAKRIENGDTKVDEEFKHTLSAIEAPEFSKAIGYGVEVQSHDEGAIEGDMCPGIVHSIDSAKGTLRIKFEVEDGDESDYEDLAFDSRDIAWISTAWGVAIKADVGGTNGHHMKHQHNEHDDSKRKIEIKEEKIPSIEESSSKEEKIENNVYVPHLLSSVSRPTIQDAIGYMVEVQSKEEDAEEGDMFPGEVVSIDKIGNTIRVAFETDEGEPDFEVLPFKSKEIAWVGRPGTKK
jgi:hypothetical protein